MTTKSFQVLGLRELGEAMSKLQTEVAQSIARSMTNAAAQVVKKAAVANIQRNPSIDTGSLKESVIVKKLPRSQSQLTSEHIVTVRRGRGKIIKRGKNKGQRQTTAPHAGFVEFGTVKMPAEPFLRPALDQEKYRVPDVMKQTGWKRIEAAARKAAGKTKKL
jgi:HK97 gp10 family phage protein